MTHILVVNPDHDTALKLARTLQPYGFNAETAISSERAIDWLLRDDMDAVVAYLPMCAPYEEDIEFIRAARLVSPTTKQLIVYDKVTRRDYESAKAAGAAKVVRTPGNVETLAQVLQQITSDRNPESLRQQELSATTTDVVAKPAQPSTEDTTGTQPACGGADNELLKNANRVTVFPTGSARKKHRRATPTVPLLRCRHRAKPGRTFARIATIGLLGAALSIIFGYVANDLPDVLTTLFSPTHAPAPTATAFRLTAPKRPRTAGQKNISTP